MICDVCKKENWGVIKRPSGRRCCGNAKCLLETVEQEDAVYASPFVELLNAVASGAPERRARAVGPGPNCHPED